MINSEKSDENLKYGFYVHGEYYWDQEELFLYYEREGTPKSEWLTEVTVLKRIYYRTIRWDTLVSRLFEDWHFEVSSSNACICDDKITTAESVYEDLLEDYYYDVYSCSSDDYYNNLVNDSLFVKEVADLDRAINLFVEVNRFIWLVGSKFKNFDPCTFSIGVPLLKEALSRLNAKFRQHYWMYQRDCQAPKKILDWTDWYKWCDWED